MNDSNESLNRLLALHSRSLPSYLASARPFSRPGIDQRASEVLQIIIDDHRRLVDQVAGLIREQDGSVSLGEFPMEFTDLHDLSLDYLVGVLIQKQQATISQIEQIAQELAGNSRGKALAQEALGAAKGHLVSLRELTAVAVP